ncbi:hypothetical protein DUNSADRAFT_6071 [Dunaliella salina]|uniref:Uncharacterized protein n=1 Tax=Dunaliella salina TaxID=3046 RepID=A0ABQ7FU04_DUNSA|nr:hypothetical protein DUNSADRAFT_6071 [Dunaliella salina]|eukprot:KAF5825898.1 hypothetical protein DUNSADRAFT_6071 [Dunaliella salina]
MLPRPGAGLISTIRFMMNEAETFLTAETGLDGSNIIAYWDLARAGASEPVHVYRSLNLLDWSTSMTNPQLVPCTNFADPNVAGSQYQNL